MSMRLLNIGQNYHVRGGSDKYMLSLSEMMARRGHKVIPFAASSADNLPTPWERYFPVAADFERPGPRDIARFIYSRPARASMKRLLRDIEVDMAHLHIYYGKLTASILAPLKEAGVPVVQTLHEYKTVCPVYTLHSDGRICEDCRGRAYWRALLNRCNRGSRARSALSALESRVSRALGSVGKIDHFIAVSDFLRNKVVELGLPAHKVTTVHNCVDVDGTEPGRIPGSYFLYYGRIERIKGVFTLAEAASSTGVPLYVVGSGGALPELKGFVEDRAIDNVRFLGFRQGAELERLIRGSICTVTPSEWYETFGLTLIESFAHGRPVIASRIGGMTEVVSHGEDGFLVTPGSVEELRDRLAWMAAHRREAVEMGAEGRKKAEELFNEELHYSRIMDVYRKVL
ncbi:MAG: glycosyltransferase family 4 protein [Thermodesulfobacteriota bacterium]